MNKQDRQGARTPADLERKYNFEQSFAEVMGIATDARTTAEKAETELTKEVARIDKEISAHEASIGLLVDNGEVQGSIIIKAINDESTAKISADRLDIEGKTLNIKVDATNIGGKLIAEQIDADGLEVKQATIGSWHLGECQIDISPTNTIRAEALYSDIMTEKRADSDGVERIYTYRTYLTPLGVYVDGLYETSYESAVPYYARKTWLEICGG